jgi:hypothetical protein
LTRPEENPTGPRRIGRSDRSAAREPDIAVTHITAASKNLRIATLQGASELAMIIAR